MLYFEEEIDDCKWQAHADHFLVCDMHLRECHKIAKRIREAMQGTEFNSAVGAKIE